jgi:hypothetical protein
MTEPEEDISLESMQIDKTVEAVVVNLLVEDDGAASENLVASSRWVEQTQ